ncbi:J domain-containing protein [Cupriavidus sp. BIS7]|uniref:J domain-containing protein n=1 Tax=Cupriavidus sp. BIS7 TaxID=1217718 RepID=UPI0002DC5A50|nr:J domain-containing protein [Cupriavidus sp. BIS7]
MHTHYDNLKVSRDAPPEVIRAAYKSLSQKYHPDRHADSEQANRIMRLLNVAYEVLSDPVRRAEHDQWIAVQEKLEAEQKRRQAQRAAQAAQAARAQPRSARPAQAAPARPASPTQPQPDAGRPGHPERAARPEKPGKTARDSGGPAAPLARKWSFLLYAAIGAAIVVLMGEWTSPDQPNVDKRGPELVRPALAAQAAASIPATLVRDVRYTRPSLTPRGLPWPADSGYLPGYPVLNTSGLSMLTVDNSRSRSDVLLKLVAVNGGTPVPVRTSFVRSGSSFTMDAIAPGSYDVRYQSLDTGEIYRSERFVFEELKEAGGTSAGRNILTLCTVPGKSRSVTITEREFP